jgi:RNA polymerase sigma-70 factor (ECF subfamily)
VLSVLYLIYNAGADDLARRDPRAEAIRLTRVLVALMPAEPEVVGLLALMLLSDARMPARGDGADIVLLKEQDRALWDQSLIGEGQALVLACMRRRRLGPFQLQAAIQALHCAAPRYEETDWPAILRFYDRLVAVLPTPVVTLNRAVATAEAEGAEEGLALLDSVAEGLDGYHLLHASRGWMLDKLGRQAEAADAYDRAAALARTDAEVSFLSRRRAELAAEVRTDSAPGVPQAKAK